jgi:hypothetical protein
MYVGERRARSVLRFRVLLNFAKKLSSRESLNCNLWSDGEHQAIVVDSAASDTV